MVTRHLSAILFLIVMAVPAAADDSKVTPAEKEKQTLESFGLANPSCQEWSDGCAVCARHDDGTFACSLPGIACEPTSPTCRPVVEAAPESGPKNGKDAAPKESGTAKPAAPDTPAK